MRLCMWHVVHVHVVLVSPRSPRAISKSIPPRSAKSESVPTPPSSLPAALMCSSRAATAPQRPAVPMPSPTYLAKYKAAAGAAAPPRSARCAIVSLLFFVFLTACTDAALHTIYLPLFRTLVTCDTPPTAPPGADGWSGSRRCGDLTVTLKKSQQWEGTLLSILLLCHVVASPFWGAVADQYGRLLVVAAGLAISGTWHLP